MARSTGAGGIGTQLMISMKLFAYGEVLSIIVAIVALVVIVDVADHSLAWGFSGMLAVLLIVPS